MRVPDFKRYRRSMQALAFFICGMIVGAAVYNAMVLDQTSRIIDDNYQLKEQLDLTESQLRADRKVSVIRNIVVFVLEPEGKKTQLSKAQEAEMKKRLTEDLSILKGRSVYDIGSDAELVRKLLENKTFTVAYDLDLTVRIRTMLVADSVLQVWAEAQPQIKGTQGRGRG